MEPLKLTPAVVGPIEVNRLIRELAAVDDFFVGAKARAAGSSVQLPQVSRMLEQLAQENGVSLLDEKVRHQLSDQLEQVNKTAPNFHISFSVEASPKALERILVWLRQNIHPQLLLQVGLQPSIAAGCVLRTTNKIFDMSLRTRLSKETKYLQELINGAANG